MCKNIVYTVCLDKWAAEELPLALIRFWRRFESRRREFVWFPPEVDAAPCQQTYCDTIQTVSMNITLNSWATWGMHKLHKPRGHTSRFKSLLLLWQRSCRLRAVRRGVGDVAKISYRIILTVKSQFYQDIYIDL